MKKHWYVEISLGGRGYCYLAESVSFEGGSLVVYNGDFFAGRDVVAAFGPGGWTFVSACKSDHPHTEEAQ